MRSSKKNIAAVSVINDLVSDNRVQRICGALAESGFEVLLIGRQLPHSPGLPPWSYKTRRMRLLFTAGPLFYFFFNFRLFFLLLRQRPTLLYANDLDTLLPNYLVSKIRGVPLIYDSHELFCEVPELAHSPLKQAMWRRLEASLVPRVKHRITVNQSIADIFAGKYKCVFTVVRNVGDFVPPRPLKSRSELGLAEDKRVILLQGAGININRGAEELLEAMREVDGAILVIIGSGDVWPVIEKKAADPVLRGKVRLINRLPAESLRHYTMNADLGVSIDKPGNLNYENSLPNKIFDYVQAGIPVLASRLKEVETILTQTGTGVFIESHNPSHIAAVIMETINGTRLAKLKESARRAQPMFSWQAEKQRLLGVIAAAKAEGA